MPGAPFADPKTQRICVPLNPENVWDFDPNDVPSLEDILRNMEENAAANKDKDRSHNAHSNCLWDIHRSCACTRGEDFQTYPAGPIPRSQRETEEERERGRQDKWHQLQQMLTLRLSAA
jgi:hypothetical protein